MDVWQDQHPDDTTTFTCVQVKDTWLCHSWLECIYIPHFHILWAHSSSIRPASFLGHHLVAVTASLTLERPGPAYWHFSSSLLEHMDFVASFREFWLSWRRPFPWYRGGETCGRSMQLHLGSQTDERYGNRVVGEGILELEKCLAAHPRDLSF